MTRLIFVLLLLLVSVPSLAGEILPEERVKEIIVNPEVALSPDPSALFNAESLTKEWFTPNFIAFLRKTDEVCGEGINVWFPGHEFPRTSDVKVAKKNLADDQVQILAKFKADIGTGTQHWQVGYIFQKIDGKWLIDKILQDSGAGLESIMDYPDICPKKDDFEMPTNLSWTFALRPHLEVLPKEAEADTSLILFCRSPDQIELRVGAYERVGKGDNKNVELTFESAGKIAALTGRSVLSANWEMTDGSELVTTIASDNSFFDVLRTGKPVLINGDIESPAKWSANGMKDAVQEFLDKCKMTPE